MTNPRLIALTEEQAERLFAMARGLEARPAALEASVGLLRSLADSYDSGIEQEDVRAFLSPDDRGKPAISELHRRERVRKALRHFTERSPDHAS